ncbi:uroporphyrinogen-III synthase [Bacillus sp. T33-2]|uniref:uroporphyrinogen-III synthase n=1 Tax=Bacillus sp. T33-2 TaxID=2054168 RepID=UPI000C77D4CB|nr:uroporphyrinogen-III synthase [Bacillus sp. T33-2]PLR93696.1 uroporphyrinogen-III synthase [Bacillus sp. T33-2]
MIASLPLHNKQIMIPRGKKQAKSFSELVERYGGIPVEIPLIAFRPVPATEELAKFLNDLYTYDWIIFTSQVTVETFFSHHEPGEVFPKVAAIGEKTKKTLEKTGVTAEFTPGEYVAEAFVREFLPFVSGGMKVLIPKGSLARGHIASSLKAAGAIVDEIVIYETYLPDESKTKLAELLSAKQLDILAFTSPSTVGHFMEIVDGNSLHAAIKDCIIACLGPVTNERALKAGLPVHACPKKYTVEEMLNSVIDYLRDQEGI